MTIANKKVNIKQRVIFSLLLVLAILFPAKLSSEIIQDNFYNFSLDIPEGYKLGDSSSDGTSYLFVHPNNQVQLAIKIYDNQDFKSAPYALENALNKLKASFSIDDFYWNKSLSAISDFVFQLFHVTHFINTEMLCLLCYFIIPDQIVVFIIPDKM